jgi:hypothetical protein
MMTMAIESHKSKSECTPTLEELVMGMQDPTGKYYHLKVFLYRSDINWMGLGQDYLVVTTEGFGLYRLMDMGFYGSIVQLKLKSLTSDEVSVVNLDINNRCPGIFLVSWSDAQELYRKAIVYPAINNNDLLELDE